MHSFSKLVSIVTLNWSRNHFSKTYIWKIYEFLIFLLNFHPKATSWWKGGQIYILPCIFLNMGLRWFILNQSYVQISYDWLENKLNDFYCKKAWFWHQEVAKIRQMQGNWSLRGSKSCFILFYQKYGIFYWARISHLE